MELIYLFNIQKYFINRVSTDFDIREDELYKIDKSTMNKYLLSILLEYKKTNSYQNGFNLSSYELAILEEFKEYLNNSELNDSSLSSLTKSFSDQELVISKIRYNH
jgi:hypothetical protein